MKTILAPVDFSDASINSLGFAAELSRRAGARLIIIHVLHNDHSDHEAKNRLNTIEADLRKAIGSELDCESVLEHGNLNPALNKIMAVQQPDLIVMGTKGASGLKRMLIGSNTVHVIAATQIPVLVIPEVARFENYLNKEKTGIVLATDLDVLENPASISILKKIALLIKEPKVRVLSVRPKNTMLPELKRAEREFLLSYFNPEIESEPITVFADNVINGINFYLTKNPEIGLIAMIARDTGHLIQKHYTREMASHTHLPLLVLHDIKN